MATAKDRRRIPNLPEPPTPPILPNPVRDRIRANNPIVEAGGMSGTIRPPFWADLQLPHSGWKRHPEIGLWGDGLRSQYRTSLRSKINVHELNMDVKAATLAH